MTHWPLLLSCLPMPNAIQCLRCCGTYVGGKLKLEGSRNPSDNSRSPCLAQNLRRGSSRSRKIEVEDGCGSPPESSSFTNPERGSPGSCTDQQSGSPFTPSLALPKSAPDTSLREQTVFAPFCQDDGSQLLML
jgi:hypothetical protein